MSVREFVANHRGRRLRFPAGVALILAAGAGLAFGGSKPSTADLETGPITVEARPIAGFDRLKRDDDTLRPAHLARRPRAHLAVEAFRRLVGPCPRSRRQGLLCHLRYRRLDVGCAYLRRQGPAARDDRGAHGRHPVEGRRSAVAHARPRRRRAGAGRRARRRRAARYISFERKHRIVRFDIDAAGLSPARGKVSLPKSARNMPANGGFEAHRRAARRALQGQARRLFRAHARRRRQSRRLDLARRGPAAQVLPDQRRRLRRDRRRAAARRRPAGAGAALPVERRRQHAPAADQAAAAAPAPGHRRRHSRRRQTAAARSTIWKGSRRTWRRTARRSSR